MLLTDYYFYFYNLEESQRNKELLIIAICLGILLIIGLVIERVKYKFMYKAKNEHIRNFLKKL